MAFEKDFQLVHEAAREFRAAVTTTEHLPITALAKMAGCAVPAIDSPGAHLLTWIRDRCVKWACDVMIEGRPPIKALSDGRRQELIDQVPDCVAGTGDAEAVRWQIVVQLEAWKMITDSPCHDGPVQQAEPDRFLAALRQIADTLARAIVKGLEKSYCTAKTHQLERAYARTLATLAEHGYTARIAMPDPDMPIIEIDLSHLGGPCYVNLANTFEGLEPNPGADECGPHGWFVGVYEREPIDGPLDIYLESRDLVELMQNATTAVRRTARVAVRTGDRWDFYRIAIEALGDRAAERRSITALSRQPLDDAALVHVVDDVRFLGRGCSTRAHPLTGDDPNHEHCEHGLFRLGPPDTELPLAD